MPGRSSSLVKSRPLHAECLEETGGDDVDRRLTGGVVLGDAGESDSVTGEVRERSASVSHIAKARIGEGAIVARGRTVLAEQADDLTQRIGPGERPDHQSVDDAEDTGIDSDAERQDAYGGQREAGMLAEKRALYRRSCQRVVHIFDIYARSVRMFHCMHNFEGPPEIDASDFAAEVHCRGMPTWPVWDSN